MSRRYEYHETDTDVAGIGAFVDAVLPGPHVSLKAVECIIYDEDTGEELARATGSSRSEARAEAESRL
jgi:hypothetical protein